MVCAVPIVVLRSWNHRKYQANAPGVPLAALKCFFHKRNRMLDGSGPLCCPAKVGIWPCPLATATGPRLSTSQESFCPPKKLRRTHACHEALPWPSPEPDLAAAPLLCPRRGPELSSQADPDSETKAPPIGDPYMKST